MNTIADVCEHQAETALDLFITVPEVTLRGGLVVPPFKVGAYFSGKQDDRLVITREAAPWVSINHDDSITACKAAGYDMLTGSQSLAIAQDIVNQDINWSGGRVGEGHVFMGLHKWNVRSAQPGTYESPDPDERRWHQLSNGSVIWDFAGNLYSHLFDDLHGDERGLIAKPFPDDSPYITTPGFPSMEKGMGWYPEAGSDWSGVALVRGGYWGSESTAGVFYLDIDWPDDENVNVGFRCTKPIGH